MAKEAYKHDPWSVETEQALLGAVFADNGKLDGLAALVQPETFYDPLHGRVYAKAVAMRTVGRSVTPLTIHEEMKSDPGIIETGGIAYLNALRSAAPAIPNVKDYATILSDLATRRGLIRLGEDLVNDAHEPPTPDFFPKILADSMDRLIGMSRSVVAPSRRAEDIARDVMKRVNEIRSGKLVPGIPTGLKLVDDAIGGMQDSDLIIMAARPGHGKSAICGGIGLNAARAGYPTLIFSLEMVDRQWAERNITDLDFDENPYDPIAYQLFRTAHFTEAQLDRIAVASTLLNNIPLEICDTPRLTMVDIGARARAFRSRYPDQLCLFIIDYLQKVEPLPGKKDRSREQEVSANAAECKSLAKALHCPVIAAAQMLTKGGDPKMANKEQIPTLAGIKESSGIEAEADIVMMPHRKSWYVRKNRPDVAEDHPDMIQWRGDLNACQNLLKLYLPKFRHGEDGEIDLFCDMRSSSVRTERPHKPTAVADRAASDLLASLGYPQT